MSLQAFEIFFWFFFSVSLAVVDSTKEPGDGLTVDVEEYYLEWIFFQTVDGLTADVENYCLEWLFLQTVDYFENRDINIINLTRAVELKRKHMLY